MLTDVLPLLEVGGVQRHLTKRLSRAISAVLRYDVSDWLDLPSLQNLLRRRFHLEVDFGDLMIAVLADPVRFELTKWEGSWWARATYRH